MYLLQKNRVYSESRQNKSAATTNLYFWKIYKNTYITMDHIARVTLNVCQGYFIIFVAQSYIKIYSNLWRELNSVRGRIPHFPFPNDKVKCFFFRIPLFLSLAFNFNNLISFIVFAWKSNIIASALFKQQPT